MSALQFRDSLIGGYRMLGRYVLYGVDMQDRRKEMLSVFLESTLQVV